MLLIAGTIRVQAEDQDAAAAAMAVMMAETVKEAGCVSYDFSSDFSDPSLFHLFEEWESEEHLKAHFEAPHMGEFRATMGELGPMERNLHTYNADAKKPLD